MNNFVNIIIDRVSPTNVFNIIFGDQVAKMETHLQTLVDDDLIEEFLFEIGRLSRISRSVSVSHQSIASIPSRLRNIGETFFLQFFPELIQKELREMERGYLHLHVDPTLKNIPWELLHDGNRFFSDKFYIGKNIGGVWRNEIRAQQEQLRLLIVSDPTDDLAWARKEGEGLYDALRSDTEYNRLSVRIISGQKITKLGLLDAMRDCDIIHYAGHLHYSNDLQEGGWLLSEGRILRAREIEKAGLNPDLVFSNSCFSSAGIDEKQADLQLYRFNDLAGAFLRAGIRNYIGTNWEINDNRYTFDFALQFYRSLVQEKSIGESLFDAREFARRTFSVDDMTWGNYALHGNPATRIFFSVSDASQERIVSARRIVQIYPTPIAREYAQFLEVQEASNNAAATLSALCATFKTAMLYTGAHILGNYRHLNLKEILPSGGISLESWIDTIYECLFAMSTLQMKYATTGLPEAMFMYRESLNKMVQWRKEFLTGAIDAKTASSYPVTFQYLLDNFLLSIHAIAKSALVYIPLASEEEEFFFEGRLVRRGHLIPPEYDHPVLQKKIDELRGKMCIYNSINDEIFSIDPYLGFDPLSEHFTFFPITEEFLHQADKNGKTEKPA